jgi:enterochelin esterase-like enzyme
VRTWLFVAIGVFLACGLSADDAQYTLGKDSQVQPDRPQGKVLQRVWDQSKVYPGTTRRYYIYVPAQYDGSAEAALMVFQDGHAYVSADGQFRAPTVIDNLIDRKEMPITIGLFVDPGHTGPLPEQPGWEPSPANRSLEYDTVSDRYATFLLDELIPELKKEYKISDDPKQRAIAGISSGGICALSVAWHRPDAFSKVLSHVGSFVDIRGGDHYPAMIRKSEPKPIRVFLQGGEGDLDNQFGHWPLANQQMAKALAFKKYDYRFEFGSGGHSGAHGGAILPESLVWLWRD